MLSSSRWSKLNSVPSVSAVTSAEISGTMPFVAVSYCRSIAWANFCDS